MRERVFRPEILDCADDGERRAVFADCPAHRVLIAEHLLGERFGEDHLVPVYKGLLGVASGEAVVEKPEEIRIYGGFFCLEVILS